MTIEIRLTGCNRRAVQVSLQEIAEGFGLKIPANPEEFLESLSLPELCAYLEARFASERGRKVEIVMLLDQAPELTKERTKRKAKAQDEILDNLSGSAPAAPADAEPEEEAPAPEVDLEELKTATIRRLRELCLVDGGTTRCDKFRKDYGKGEKQFTKMPAAVFVDIAKELDEEGIA